MTGESAKAGKEIQDTVTLAFEEVGNKVGSYTIELDFVDATSDADKGEHWHWKKASLREATKWS